MEAPPIVPSSSPEKSHSTSSTEARAPDASHLDHEVRINNVKAREAGAIERRLGLTWRDLTVKGIGADEAVNENFLSQFNIPQQIREGRGPPQSKTILDNLNGCVLPGEMLLVLGRPGAGCTTLLKILANQRVGFKSIEGDVCYGTMNDKEAMQYQGQIVMNMEEDCLFPTLTVDQTLDFAVRTKTSQRSVTHIPGSGEKPEGKAQRDFLLNCLDIGHTNDSRVGNAVRRGVSGGERKRVAIAETMANRATISLWDQSTRGLDASTALQFTQVLRTMTSRLKLTTVASFYQAGNAILQHFDKVLLLDQGVQLYFGPVNEALPYMQQLGFVCTRGANVADFLTGTTVATERIIEPGYENKYPRDVQAARDAFEESAQKTRMVAEREQYLSSPDTRVSTDEFRHSVRAEQDKSLPEKSPLTVDLKTQVTAAIIRQYRLIRGDKSTFILVQGTTVILSLLAASLFYNAPDNSVGVFIKGGALFFCLLYNALAAIAEVTNSYNARPIVSKHRSFAMYHPAALCIAQVAADLPILIFQVTVFITPIYWMVGLKATAAAYFTSWAIVFATAITSTAMFRCIGAGFKNFDDANNLAGTIISFTIVYTGYLIPKPLMHPWFVWLYWINPLAYGFEALLSNEFKSQTLPCVGPNLIPSGPGYDGFQACAGVPGALPGATSVTGEQYLATLSYSPSNIWRNFGIIWAWWVLYFGLTVLFTSRWTLESGNSGYTLVPRELKKRFTQSLARDEEGQQDGRPCREEDSNEEEKYESRVQSIERGSTDRSDSDIRLQEDGEKDSFTQKDAAKSKTLSWSRLSYSVPTSNGDRMLLQDVQGWVKPGMLGALMGSSGAGKTTLLDVLAQRKTQGTIHGSVLLDGEQLPVSFQRTTAYCEQMDIHEPLATVREALVFSALLRQAHETPRHEKLEYVDKIIELLDLKSIENSLIGTPQAGLSVEQRKRLTIGVELVAKPSLLFLDEPTSGLDGQAAYNIVRFLRKLADSGQAVLCTIHQPSAALFNQFDTLLLLAKGGRTTYFGDIGHDGNTVTQYFESHGADSCAREYNPAEYIIDVVSGTLSRGKDWSDIWLASPENSARQKELEQLVAATTRTSTSPGADSEHKEFATPFWEQTKLVTHRMNVALWRDNLYTTNKISLHIFAGIFNGFSFWRAGRGQSVASLQQRLFTIFNFIFVAPGAIAQLQPLFIQRRDVFETREKKSKMYHWAPFVTGLIASEIPYLLLGGILHFVTWYYTVGFPATPSKAGGVLLISVVYEFIYTGIGQFVAAYAPTVEFAAMVNPLILNALLAFSGVLVPYPQITAFWRYWIYWLNPFNYLMGGLLTFTTYDVPVVCNEEELAIFDTPNGQTCAAYLADYLSSGAGNRANLTNPDDISGCRVCLYRTGADYLNLLNLTDYSFAWRNAAICILFALSSYAMVFLCMKLRTKRSKKATG